MERNNPENFKIEIAYDGTAYHGWQRQKEDRTIQEEIEKALITMTGKQITLLGSGRTDAGVHAFGQVASFKSDAGLSSEVFLKGLNSLLPDDIHITSCQRVDPEFHPRYNARSKIYRYQILNREMPTIMQRYFVWHIKQPLELAAMRKATFHIVGKHDFKAFEAVGSPRISTIRDVIKAEWRRHKDGNILFEIEADGFLRYMVRNIVGTLVDVGRRKLSPDDVNTILLSRDRRLAGATAPAKGLFLIKVNY